MKSKRNSWGFALLAFVMSACASTSNSPRSLSKSERIEGLMNIAAAAVSDNNSIAALEALNQVKDLDDSIPRVHYLYALAYLNKNESALAEASAREAISLDPKFTAAKNALGKILLDQGKYAESEKLLKEAASDILYPEASLSKTNLGILYYKKMDLKNAETWLKNANFEKGPYLCVSQFYLGKVKMDQHDPKNASRNFMASLKGPCSGMSDVHLALGQSLIHEKKYDLARAKFVEIQKIFPNSDASDRATELLKGIP